MFINLGVTKKAIECCHENGSPLPPRHKHPLCAPITIPKLDPFFHPLGRTCMNYVRSALALPHDCTFGYRDQVTRQYCVVLITNRKIIYTSMISGQSSYSLFRRINDLRYFVK